MSQVIGYFFNDGNKFATRLVNDLAAWNEAIKTFQGKNLKQLQFFLLSNVNNESTCVHWLTNWLMKVQYMVVSIAFL